MKNRTINVKGSAVTLVRKEQDYYISLTDIARYRNPHEPMAEYRQIVTQLEAAQQALKAELMACLGGKG